MRHSMQLIIHSTADFVLNELGRVLVNLSNIVPAGIVCFLTSYGYEKTVINHLEKTGVLEKIAVKKK
ncbi:ATP-dependent DNA helicase DDX11-like, partial [Nilaparvata lugens]|uniref:ATP-dependent DNA helicase DDX11-like n=1 Tax=Nilaparvata lugens TaxID=108931 RepID=UPI00193C9895